MAQNREVLTYSTQDLIDCVSVLQVERSGSWTIYYSIAFVFFIHPKTTSIILFPVFVLKDNTNSIPAFSIVHHHVWFMPKCLHGPHFIWKCTTTSRKHSIVYILELWFVHWLQNSFSLSGLRLNRQQYVITWYKKYLYVHREGTFGLISNFVSSVINANQIRSFICSNHFAVAVEILERLFFDHFQQFSRSWLNNQLNVFFDCFSSMDDFNLIFPRYFEWQLYVSEQRIQWK